MTLYDPQLERLDDELLELPGLVSVLTEEETKLYEIQVRKMMIDNTLPAATDNNGDIDIVKWYGHLSKEYPAVHKMAMSVMSIFQGRIKVESSFSSMGDVIDKKINWICYCTYSAIQNVKYSMWAQSKFQLFPKHPTL